MPGDVTIHINVDASGHYGFRVRSGRSEITSTVSPDGPRVELL